MSLTMAQTITAWGERYGPHIYLLNNLDQVDLPVEPVEPMDPVDPVDPVRSSHRKFEHIDAGASQFDYQGKLDSNACAFIHLSLVLGFLVTRDEFMSSIDELMQSDKYKDYRVTLGKDIAYSKNGGHFVSGALVQFFLIDNGWEVNTGNGIETLYISGQDGCTFTIKHRNNHFTLEYACVPINDHRVKILEHAGSGNWEGTFVFPL